jgi:hypothetical protein
VAIGKTDLLKRTDKREAHRLFSTTYPKKLRTTQQTIARPPKDLTFQQFFKQKCTCYPPFVRTYLLADVSSQYISGKPELSAVYL